MNKTEFLTRDLPDPIAASRFLDVFADKHLARINSLLKNEALLSDVLTLASYSPLLATTLLTHPEYLTWLNRERSQKGVRSKEDLLESLARFALTNSAAASDIIFARFRRRELMRIFLNDIRRLSTIVEITEEISNLADTILENALRITRQELDNRYGTPLETDEKGRARPAEFSIVSLGKLGSKELNYSSDIDLLFLYSAEGRTSGTGSREAITNREYFVKLAEAITKLIGRPGGEGAPYRVDLRLRPHGRVGPLAMSVEDTARYYLDEARAWERQVLIRSRSSAGEPTLYKKFFSLVENAVFARGGSIADALRNVKLSKQKIDLEQHSRRGFDVKLGRGGIREIEFIAQALQLAYGGNDKWLRAPHTLISLSRLADRKLIGEHELTQLFEAYEFLRHLEHILQMENGLQTHLVPLDDAKRALIAKRAGFPDGLKFEKRLAEHTGNVNAVFERVFADVDEEDLPSENAAGRTWDATFFPVPNDASPPGKPIFMLHRFEGLREFEKIDSSPLELRTDEYPDLLLAAVRGESDFRGRLAALRCQWNSLLFEIVKIDIAETLPLEQIKHAQTKLAEASINAALEIARRELEKRYSAAIDKLSLAVIALGKLGGGGLDYDSDLDLVLIYDESAPIGSAAPGEFYSRAAELFVTALSGMTKDGNLYRVDLRLRPYGKNGPSVISRTAFTDYMSSAAAIWELLAYVKLRAAGGDRALANSLETETRDLIHRRALKHDRAEIAAETRRIRERLEKEKAGRARDLDIKFGPGGMLDIYFAIRCLQLCENVPDDPESRSTCEMLKKLKDQGILDVENFESFYNGYRFLSLLDHNIRLTVGRSSRLPHTNMEAMNVIVQRSKTVSVDALMESLALHRLAVRAAFEKTVI